MGGKGKSVRHSQPRNVWKKPIKRCKNKGSADNFVVIDVDSDSFPNVILIDIPESLPTKPRGSSSSALREDNKCSSRTIIDLDDDEYTENNQPEVGVKGDENSFRDASCSKESFPATDHCNKSTDAVGDECQFVQENISPVKISKCKRTYSGKASTRNRYGFNTDSESGSSDNEVLDCELLEDSYGKLREQWEKASMRRKTDVCNDVGAEHKTEQRAEVPLSPKKARNEKEDQSPSTAMGNRNSGSTCSPKIPGSYDKDLKPMNESPPCQTEEDVQARAESFAEHASHNYDESQTQKHADHFGFSFQKDEEISPHGPTFRHGQKTKQVNNAAESSQAKEEVSQTGPTISDTDRSDKCSFHTKANVQDREDSFCKGKPSDDPDIDQLRSVLSDMGEMLLQKPESGHGNSFKEKGKSTSRESLDQTVSPSNAKVVSVPEETVYKNPLSRRSDVSIEKGRDQEKWELLREDLPFCSMQCNESVPKNGRSCVMGVKVVSSEFMSNSQRENGKDNPIYTQDDDTVPSSLISEREKLKETEEYKRAVEEEWASRQRELQLQAEAAQELRRLQKRKKAESMRILDVERRQKQRLEEIWKTQKKDEEDMNSKELLRASVRKELNKLEFTCKDMASLLRGLGIHVGGAVKPSPNEVHAAYKKAVLSFHPDRASRLNLRQQVEAEEKFKLISRMKEKFLPAS